MAMVCFFFASVWRGLDVQSLVGSLFAFELMLVAIGRVLYLNGAVIDVKSVLAESCDFSQDSVWLLSSDMGAKSHFTLRD